MVLQSEVGQFCFFFFPWRDTLQPSCVSWQELIYFFTCCNVLQLQQGWAALQGSMTWQWLKGNTRGGCKLQGADSTASSCLSSSHTTEIRGLIHHPNRAPVTHSEEVTFLPLHCWWDAASCRIAGAKADEQWVLAYVWASDLQMIDKGAAVRLDL